MEKKKLAEEYALKEYTRVNGEMPYFKSEKEIQELINKKLKL